MTKTVLLIILKHNLHNHNHIHNLQCGTATIIKRKNQVNFDYQ